MRSLAIATLTLLCGVAHAQTHVVLGVNIVDVATGSVSPDQAVAIEDGKIAWIGPAAGSPKADTLTTADGLYLIPGLIDSHVHYTSPATYNPLMIAHGVVMVREMGNTSEMVFPLRDALNAGDAIGPEMIACGEIIDGSPPVWPFSEPCDTPEQAREAVDRVAARGADQIKLYSMLKPDAFAAACRRARELGLKPVGHVPTAVPIQDTLDLGYACVEHLTGIDTYILRLARPELDHDPDFIEASGGWLLMGEIDPARLRPLFESIARAGQVHCPTLAVMEGIGSIASGKGPEHPATKFIPASFRAFWDSPAYAEWSAHAGGNVPRMQRVVGMMRDAGVTLIAGTDLGNPYVFAGESLHRELELLRDAGLSDAECLRAATISPATFHGVADRLGSIEVGKDASFVLLRENPLEDISATRSIEHVFLRGRDFDTDALDALLRQALDAAQQAPDPAAQADSGSRLGDIRLPGRVVHRGQYSATFGGQPAGVEEFIVTRDGDGWHIAAHNRPLGGMQQPFLLEAHASDDFEITSITWRQLSTPELRVVSTIRNGVISVVATRGDTPAGEQRVEIPDDALLATPALVGDFLAMRNLDLEPGDSRKTRSITFGFPTWQWTTTDATISREPNRTLRIGEREVEVMVYRTQLATPLGAFTVTTSIRDDGLTVRSVVDMPFGQVVAELEP
ncbi:MAG: amidohydrolase family protein [Phycisphaeraceae bacterium]|nr:amidohydrolase family protein [Phycisphaeraceae bacterium]